MTDDVAGSDAEADRIIDKLKYSKRELEIKNLVEYCKELSKKNGIFTGISRSACTIKILHRSI
jgi:adenylate kinase family enzyme